MLTETCLVAAIVAKKTASQPRQNNKIPSLSVSSILLSWRGMRQVDPSSCTRHGSTTTSWQSAIPFLTAVCRCAWNTRTSFRSLIDLGRHKQT